jgi:hypothetical protein
MHIKVLSWFTACEIAMTVGRCGSRSGKRGPEEIGRFLVDLI